MFSKKERYILKDKILRTTQIKHKFLKKIGQNFITNPQTFNIKRYKIWLLNLNKKGHIYKVKNICLLSGENKGVAKKLLLSRFTLNKLCVHNQIQNFKINS